jgi:hypothetical protein
VPDGPQTTRFSCRLIYSRVRSAFLGRGRHGGQHVVPGVEGFAGGECGAGPAGGQRGTVPAGDFLGEQRPEHFGGVPPLGFGDSQDLGGDAAHVREPHPPH